MLHSLQRIMYLPNVIQPSIKGLDFICLFPGRFAVVDPSNWNKLAQSHRDLLPISSFYHFSKHLKISLFVSEDTDPAVLEWNC